MTPSSVCPSYPLATLTSFLSPPQCQVLFYFWTLPMYSLCSPQLSILHVTSVPLVLESRPPLREHPSPLLKWTKASPSSLSCHRIYFLRSHSPHPRSVSFMYVGVYCLPVPHFCSQEDKGSRRQDVAHVIQPCVPSKPSAQQGAWLTCICRMNESPGEILLRIIDELVIMCQPVPSKWTSSMYISCSHHPKVGFPIPILEFWKQAQR